MVENTTKKEIRTGELNLTEKAKHRVQWFHRSGCKKGRNGTKTGEDGAQGTGGSVLWAQKNRQGEERKGREREGRGLGTGGSAWRRKKHRQGEERKRGE